MTSARRRPLRLLAILGLVLGLLQSLVLAEPPAQTRAVPVLPVSGAIGPASADFIVSGITKASEEGAPMVVIRMDTPGGLDTSMRDIIRAIVNAPIPVVTYVSPSGARAASAGAFILTASHVAAMAPGTNVGAATPVQLGAPGPSSSDKPGDGKKNGTEAGKAGGQKSASEPKRSTTP